MSQFLSPELVNRLNGASERIRRVTEELELSVVAVEEFLQSLNLGIPASAWIEQSDAPHRLVFGPAADAADKPWTLRLERIAAGSVGEAGRPAQVEAAWPLGEAPKRLLLEAASAVPNLIESIAATAAAEAERIEQALARLRGPSDEVTIVDAQTREKLDRDFLDAYARRMRDESERGAVVEPAKVKARR